jgi:hypothetical protein
MAFVIAGTFKQRTRGHQLSFRSLSWLIFCAALFVVSITWNLETSLSPDVAIWLLPMVVATTLTDPNTPKAQRVVTSCLLAGLACLLKLTALPVLFYLLIAIVPSSIRTMGWSDRAKCLSFVLAAGLVGGAAYWRLSGCPAFPAVAFCREGDWTVGARVAESVKRLMTQYVQEHGLLKSETLPLVFLAGVFSVLALWNGRSHSLVRHGLGMCWIGIGFVMWQAPNARYALGYLLLPMSLGVAVWLARFRLKSIGAGFAAIRQWRSSLFASAFVTLGLGIFFNSIVGHDFVVPRRMARTDGDSIRIVTRQMQTEAVFSVSSDRHAPLPILRPSASDQCWDAEVPCTPRLTFTGVGLRDESRGYSEGLVRVRSRDASAPRVSILQAQVAWEGR